MLLRSLLTVCSILRVAAASTPSLSIADYPSIQEALDRNPGRMLFVPAGDYPITNAIKIKAPNSGLWGPGRIIQANPDAAVIDAQNVAGLQLRDLTLTRAEGKKESTKGAVLVTKCSGATLAGLQVLDNWANANAVSVVESPRCQIRDCLVENYSRIAIDDRTKTSFLGYAFNCIDGTGISVNGCVGAMILHNRVIESRMLPTPELKAKYNLGKFVKKNAVKGWHISQEAWDAEYFNGWHQGSAIVVNSGETGDCIQLLGNYVENAAQGIDIHGDHVIMANNIINNSFIGMKAVHGSRNVLLSANQFSKNDLWSILLAPGTASHAAGESVELSGGRRSNPAANVDGYSIVANNIISDFGYGNAHWNWPVSLPNVAPLRLGADGFAEQGKPVVHDVIIQGNVIYDTGRDQILVDGKPRVEPPRYAYAVRIADGKNQPSGLLFADNLFHPGTAGVSSADTKSQKEAQ
jgi:hypothetical protein